MQATRRGENKQITKCRNRGLLLQLLSTGQCVSRMELAREMRLSRMAVSNMVGELLEKDILSEGPSSLQERAGRRPICLELHPRAPKVIGILIFRDRLEAVLCDLFCRIQKRLCRPMASLTAETLPAAICEQIDALLAEEPRILGVGISCISPMDPVRGRLLNPCHFHIANVPIVDALRERYDFPIRMEDDNLCGALAEKLYGAGRAYRDILLLGIGAGVGCGLILDGEPYQNQRRLVPEFGHTSIDAHGRLCACGRRGCIQSYISTDAMQEAVSRATGRQEPFSALCAADQDPAVDAALRACMDLLAFALLNTINLLNCELVLLAHDGVLLSKKQLSYLESQLNAHKYAPAAYPVRVMHPQFGRDAQLVGAACLILGEVFAGNIAL